MQVPKSCIWFICPPLSEAFFSHLHDTHELSSPNIPQRLFGPVCLSLIHTSLRELPCFPASAVQPPSPTLTPALLCFLCWWKQTTFSFYINCAEMTTFSTSKIHHCLYPSKSCHWPEIPTTDISHLRCAFWGSPPIASVWRNFSWCPQNAISIFCRSQNSDATLHTSLIIYRFPEHYSPSLPGCLTCTSKFNHLFPLLPSSAFIYTQVEQLMPSGASPHVHHFSPLPWLKL